MPQKCLRFLWRNYSCVAQEPWSIAILGSCFSGILFFAPLFLFSGRNSTLFLLLAIKAWKLAVYSKQFMILIMSEPEGISSGSCMYCNNFSNLNPSTPGYPFPCQTRWSETVKVWLKASPSIVSIKSPVLYQTELPPTMLNLNYWCWLGSIWSFEIGLLYSIFRRQPIPASMKYRINSKGAFIPTNSQHRVFAW